MNRGCPLPGVSRQVRGGLIIAATVGNAQSDFRHPTRVEKADWAMPFLWITIPFHRMMENSFRRSSCYFRQIISHIIPRISPEKLLHILNPIFFFITDLTAQSLARASYVYIIHGACKVGLDGFVTPTAEFSSCASRIYYRH